MSKKNPKKKVFIIYFIAVYDFEESIEFAFEEWEEIWLNKTESYDKIMNETYKNVDAVVDFPHSFFFEEFLKYYPDAKVIFDFFKSFSSSKYSAIFFY